jgi:LacI family transcriptional regulator
MSKSEIIEKEVTIYDIAARLSLSPSTISRGLQDHPAIKDSTKKKIFALARELGYRQNSFARNIRLHRSNTIGVITPRLNSNFMSTVLAGIESIASRENFNLVIGQSLESSEQEISKVEMMFNTRVDGLLVSLSGDANNVNHFEPFFRKNIPVIFFDRTPNLRQATNILIDNFQASYKATQHLIHQGCKNIVHITANSKINVYKDRLKGYRQALEDNGLIFNEDNVLFGDLSQEFGVKAADIIRSMYKKPDGVFVSNDYCAAACMAALKKAGYLIPKDIAFVGFNNDPVSTIIEPNLTTINYPGLQMGEVAAQNLIDHLNGTLPINATNEIILRSELITRASSLR